MLEEEDPDFLKWENSDTPSDYMTMEDPNHDNSRILEPTLQEMRLTTWGLIVRFIVSQSFAFYMGRVCIEIVYSD